MNTLLAAPEVRVYWASLHDWPQGSEWISHGGVARLWLVQQGMMEVSDMAGEQHWHLKAGDLFLGSGYDYKVATPTGARWLSMGWRATALNSLDLLQLLQPPRIWQPDETARHFFASLMGCLLECWHGTPEYPASRPNAMINSMDIAGRHDTATEFTCRSIASAILGQCWHLLDDHEVQRAVARVPNWLTIALRRFSEDPAADITTVARDVGLSPAQFRRSFRQWTGVAPRDYHKEQRLNMARRLLETTDLPISAIAQRLGFKSTSHFIRLWHQSQGISPAQHRIVARSAKI